MTARGDALAGAPPAAAFGAIIPIPGAREPGALTTFRSAAVMPVPHGSCTMDSATIADREREGGGAPDQRRPRPRPPSA